MKRAAFAGFQTQGSVDGIPVNQLPQSRDDRMFSGMHNFMQLSCRLSGEGFDPLTMNAGLLHILNFLNNAQAAVRDIGHGRMVRLQSCGRNLR